MKQNNFPLYNARFRCAHLLTLLAPKIVKLTLSKAKWRYSIQDYRNFPVGTVAREIANYSTVPNCFSRSNKESTHHGKLDYLFVPTFLCDEIRRHFFRGRAWSHVAPMLLEVFQKMLSWNLEIGREVQGITASMKLLPHRRVLRSFRRNTGR